MESHRILPDVIFRLGEKETAAMRSQIVTAAEGLETMRPQIATASRPACDGILPDHYAQLSENELRMFERMCRRRLEKFLMPIVVRDFD